VYIETYSSQHWEAGQAKDLKKNGTALNATCHFVHACHWFVSPGLGLRISFLFKPLSDWKIYNFAFDFNVDIAF
jgi:hypothetical protein